MPVLIPLTMVVCFWVPSLFAGFFDHHEHAFFVLFPVRNLEAAQHIETVGRELKKRMKKEEKP